MGEFVFCSTEQTGLCWNITCDLIDDSGSSYRFENCMSMYGSKLNLMLANDR